MQNNIFTSNSVIGKWVTNLETTTNLALLATRTFQVGYSFKDGLRQYTITNVLTDGYVIKIPRATTVEEVCQFLNTNKYRPLTKKEYFELVNYQAKKILIPTEKEVLLSKAVNFLPIEPKVEYNFITAFHKDNNCQLTINRHIKGVELIELGFTKFIRN